MTPLRKWTADAWLAPAYFGLGAVALLATRFDGGLAYLWLANAVLITALGRRPRRAWPPALLWGGAGAFLSTGLFGAGFAAAPALALGNMVEAAVVAYILRRSGVGLLPLGSPRWMATFVFAAGIAGPLAMVAIAAVPLWLHSGLDPLGSAIRGLVAHGFANVIFIPIFKLFATSSGGRWRGRREQQGGASVPILFGIQLAVTIWVFTLEGLPLLFLPLLPVIAIVFRGSSRASAVSLMLLAAISSGATLVGQGPISLDGVGKGHEVQFLGFYLLAAVLTIVPIAAQIRRAEWLAGCIRDSEARYRMLADHSGDVIMHNDEDGILRFVSPSIERVGGYRPAELIGRPIIDIIHSDFHELVRGHYAFAMSGEGHDARFEYQALRGDGQWGWFESECRGLSDGDGPRGGVSIIRDISERKRREEQLALAALTDPLTGLPNRRAFREAAARLTDTSGACIAVFDIDHFKSVNDRFGHDAGDEVLQSFALSARQYLREGDVIARFGGEEFAVLLPGTDEIDAIALCERLRSAVAASVCVTDAGLVRFTISGGVAALGPDGLDAALKRADMALYQAKHQGRDRLMRAAA